MKEDLIFGIHASKQFLNHSADQVVEVVLQDGLVAERLQKELNLGNLHLSYQKKQILDELCTGGNHQGILLKIRPSEVRNEKQLKHFLDDLMLEKKEPLLLVLDGITDPHNLGACLRSAAAAGVDAVILPKDKSASINATVRKVAVGAADSLNIFVVTNLARSIEMLKKSGIWLVGTTLHEEARSLYHSDLRGALAIVMGSEGEGLRRLTREKCDFLCYIPMAAEMQSLNVSVATGICLFESIRQRQNPS